MPRKRYTPEEIVAKLRQVDVLVSQGQNIADAQKKLEDWRKYYNEERPHGAIGNKTPIMLLNHVGAASPPS